MKKLKEWAGIVGGMVSLGGFLYMAFTLPYRVEALERTQLEHRTDHDLLIEMRRDIIYIKDAVDKLDKQKANK